MHQVAMDRETLVGRDFIETLDWTVEEIEEALAVAGELKTAFKNGVPHRLLPDKTLFMLFLDKSTRTRNAFESGMTQLGGHAIYLDAEKTQVAHGESPKDMGIILSRYGHGLAIRHDLAPYEGNAWMREIAKWADIPLINLQCDVDHPTQTLADVLTLVGDQAIVYVELKGAWIERQVIDVIREGRAQCAVHSFDHAAIARASAIAPEVRRGLLFSRQPADPAAAFANEDLLFNPLLDRVLGESQQLAHQLDASADQPVLADVHPGRIAVRAPEIIDDALRQRVVVDRQEQGRRCRPEGLKRADRRDHPARQEQAGQDRQQQGPPPRELQEPPGLPRPPR